MPVIGNKLLEEIATTFIGAGLRIIENNSTYGSARQALHCGPTVFKT